jgi:predicted phosphodiesterase
MPRGDRALPEACIARLRTADAILHAGDLTAAEVLELLESFGPPVHAVHGNVDEPELRMRLPAVRVVEADAVVFGHSHMPLHEEREGFHVFNPGSPTERRRAPGHTMGMATARAGSLKFELVAL